MSARGDLAGAVDLEPGIQRIFREHLHVEVPAPETDLFEQGLLDSLGLVDLLAALAEEMGARLAVESLEIEDLRTIGSIARLVAGAAVR